MWRASRDVNVRHADTRDEDLQVSACLTVVSHSSTSATVAARFASDEALDDRGRTWAVEAKLGAHATRIDRAVCSPARSCRETASALGLTAGVDPLLRDWDVGRWRGRTLDEVAATEPEAVHTWLTEPTAAPHDGEPLVALLARVGQWLAAGPDSGHTVAVTHPAVMRGVVLCVLGAPPTGFWRIDVAPLTAIVLRGGPSRWTLRSTGVPLRPRR